MDERKNPAGIRIAANATPLRASQPHDPGNHDWTRRVFRQWLPGVHGGRNRRRRARPGGHHLNRNYVGQADVAVLRIPQNGASSSRVAGS